MWGHMKFPPRQHCWIRSKFENNFTSFPKTEFLLLKLLTYWLDSVKINSDVRIVYQARNIKIFVIVWQCNINI